MIIPISWLKKFINLEESNDQIALDLSFLGHEVEEYNKDRFICDITPNRGDCLSILGIARDLSAYKNLELDKSQISLQPKNRIQTKLPKIQIKQKVNCPLYCYIVLKNCKIEDSPGWIKAALTSINIRPINNIVDITNLVMMETGQPLHAFDLDKIKGQEMTIRNSNQGETITTLDDEKIDLPKDMLVIQDKNQLIDLAGVMGGKSSEIDNGSKNILLQAAVFSPETIRRSTKTLNKFTDAAYRYERGIDMVNCSKYLEYAAELCERYATAQASETQIIRNNNYRPVVIHYSKKDIDRILGISVSKDEIDKIFQKLELKKIDDNRVAIPSHRADDLMIWQDLAEEVARIHGYAKINPKPLPNKKIRSKNQTYFATEKIKDIFAENNYFETSNYSFISEDDLKIIGIKQKPLKIIKPVSKLNEFLRPNLLIGFLKSIACNPYIPDIKLFEIGTVFGGDRELLHLGIASTSPNSALLGDELTDIAKKINIKIDTKFEKISKNVLDKFKIKRPVYYKELELGTILQNIDISNYKLIPITKIKFQPYPKLPPVVRDLAFIVNSDVNAEEMGMYINDLDSLIFSVDCFDEFVSDKFGKNKKNLAYHLILQPQKKTLTETEIKTIIDKIIISVNKEFYAKIRKD